MHFVRRTPAAGRAATALLVAGALAHTFVIGMQTMEAGHVPFAGTTQAISTFVWLLALAYLYTEVTTDERGLGIFMLPSSSRCRCCRRCRGRRSSRDRPCSSIRCSGPTSRRCSGRTQLRPRRGHRHHLRAAVQGDQGQAPGVLLHAAAVAPGARRDELAHGVHRLAADDRRLGAGALWVAEATTLAPGDPRVQAMSLTDPKIFVAIMTWAVYTFQLVARQRDRMARARRAAYLSAVGFAIVLLNFVLVSYFLTDSHNFGARLRGEGQHVGWMRADPADAAKPRER